ncbi:Chaperone DnaJ-domain superfamily protein [Hirschfeldia incana]|nr:Chaperone DnaJ-domain superfamily protein [Hirschfeldia incana]
MSEPMSATVISEKTVRAAEEQYLRGNLKGALEILHALTFVFPNTSTNHRKISQVNVAHQIHWRYVNTNSFTPYDILGVNPFCDYQTARRQYMHIMAKLCPEKNKSAAAKLAFKIINATWMVLFDYGRIRVRNIEQELRNMFREDEPHIQSVREGKRPCVDIIDSDSDSDSD